jgi:hypothetical protein
MSIGTNVSLHDIFDYPKTTKPVPICDKHNCWVYDILGTNEDCRVPNRRGTKYKKFCRDSHKPSDYVNYYSSGKRMVKSSKKWVDRCGIDFKSLEAKMPRNVRATL